MRLAGSRLHLPPAVNAVKDFPSRRPSAFVARQVARPGAATRELNRWRDWAPEILNGVDRWSPCALPQCLHPPTDRRGTRTATQRNQRACNSRTREMMCYLNTYLTSGRLSKQCGSCWLTQESLDGGKCDQACLSVALMKTIIEAFRPAFAKLIRRDRDHESQRTSTDGDFTWPA